MTSPSLSNQALLGLARKSRKCITMDLWMIEMWQKRPVNKIWWTKVAFLDINLIIQSSAGRLIAYLPHLWFVLDLISSPLLEAHCRILQGAHIYWILTTPYWSSPLIFSHASHNAPNLAELKKGKLQLRALSYLGITDKGRHTKWITRNLNIKTKILLYWSICISIQEILSTQFCPTPCWDLVSVCFAENLVLSSHK